MCVCVCVCGIWICYFLQGTDTFALNFNVNDHPCGLPVPVAARCKV